MKYSKSEIMKRGHKLAKLHREEFNSYREALSYGLSQAWKEAGANTLVLEEETHVVQADVNEEFAQSCMGNVKIAC